TALIEKLKEGSSNDRTAAADELGKLGNEALPAMPWLVKIVSMKGPTNFEVFSKRVDPGRVAAARAINKIDSTQLRPALQQAQQCTYLYVQIWAQQSLKNLNGEASGTPAQQPKRFKELSGPLKTR